MSRVFRVFGWVIVVALIINIGLAIRGYDSLPLRAWLRLSSFNRIHKGMTKNQVRAIVGRPKAVEPNPQCARWTYDLANPAPSAKGSGRGQSGDFVFVYFRGNGRVSYTAPPNAKVGNGHVIVPGMTEKQVLQLAGKPHSVRETSAESWVYRHWNGTEHQVEFDKKGRVYWTVEYYDVLSCPGKWRGRSYAHD